MRAEALALHEKCKWCIAKLGCDIWGNWVSVRKSYLHALAAHRLPSDGWLRSSEPSPPSVVDEPMLTFNTTSFMVGLRVTTQTVERLSPVGSPDFSFAASSTAPSNRTGPFFEHLGDLTFRTKSEDGVRTFSTAAAGSIALPVLPKKTGEIAAADHFLSYVRL